MKNTKKFEVVCNHTDFDDKDNKDKAMEPA